MKRRAKHGLAVWMIVPILAACGSGPIAACEAWRSHLHGGESPATAVEAATASNDRAFAAALVALASGEASNDQVRLVFETCAAAGRPLLDSAHTGEGE